VRLAPFADPAAIRLMAYSLTWLPGVLLDAGLTVAEQPGLGKPPHVGERAEKQLITAFCDKIAELREIGAKPLDWL
jgi:hypothetical protein